MASPVPTPSSDSSPSALATADREPNPRRWFLHTLAGMGILLIVMVLAGRYFRPQLQAIGFRFLHHFGPAGLAVGSFLADGFHSPIPPQFYLFTAITTGFSPARALSLVFAGSVAGACTSITLGFYGSRLRFLRPFFERSRHRVDGLFVRYGAWAVVIGSFTPAPFSLLCNLAGFYRVPLLMRALLVVLRVLRLYLYYLLMRAGWS